MALSASGSIPTKPAKWLSLIPVTGRLALRKEHQEAIQGWTHYEAQGTYAFEVESEAVQGEQAQR